MSGIQSEIFRDAKKQEKTHNENNQSMRTDPDLPGRRQLADKDIKTVIFNCILYVQKLIRNYGRYKKTQIKFLR